MRKFKIFAMAGAFGALALIGAACAQPQAIAQQAPTYVPQNRDVVVSAVPLLVHEQQGQFDYLKKAFAKNGILKGKEIWGFAPGSLTVYLGDKVRVSVVNPGDDPHTFTISEFSVNAPIKGGGSTTPVSFTASRVGTFKFFCAIPEHAPYMWGTITVLPGSAAN